MRMMTYKNLNIYIQNYFKMIDDGLPVSKEILLARDKILKDMAQPGVYTDDEMVEECVKYIEKWYYELFPWEKFVIALVFTYKDDDLLYNEIFIMMGRGNGKNGFISGLANFLQTNKHGIKKYGVDSGYLTLDIKKYFIENNIFGVFGYRRYGTSESRKEKNKYEKEKITENNSLFQSVIF